MAGDRYVALGLGAARASWFTDLARWATVGSVPVEFVKCISTDELRVRLTSGRRFSVALVDANSGAVDRDLLDLASRASVPLVVIDDGRGARDWAAIGVAHTLPAPFTRERLLETLGTTSAKIGGAATFPAAVALPGRPAIEGRLVAVTGPGGAGASSVTVALAQGLSRSAMSPAQVVLADLALDAEQAMLHDARDIVPGIQELAEAHRHSQVASAEVQALTFTVVSRGYQLLLGLRRHRDWTALRPRSFDAAIDGLLRAFTWVVADCEGDVEGELETGSVEIEERNLMARTACHRAHAVVVVGRPGMKGLHAQVRLVHALRDFGVPPSRLLPVVNNSSRNQRERAEWHRTFAELTGGADGRSPVIGPIHLPTVRGLDERHRDGAPLPAALVAPITRAVEAVVARADPNVVELVPERIRPGSLGTWSDDEFVAER